jgi:hypothetical protein
MTTDHIRTVGAIEGEMRLPLPGLYPCLTWQLNVTLHKQQQAAKFVSVIREPSDKVEIHRAFSDLTDWPTVARMVYGHAEQCLDDMSYLQCLGWRQTP